MSFRRTCWSRISVATSVTAIAASMSANPAQATERHRLRHNEPLTAFARRYHCSLRDLVRVNHIHNERDVPDGELLKIPTAPERLHLSPRLDRNGRIHGDRISIRLGPGESYRRETLVDDSTPIELTARRDDWGQVRLESGKSGWVRLDFLRFPHESRAEKTHWKSEAVDASRHQERVAELHLLRLHKKRLIRLAALHKVHLHHLAELHNAHLRRLAALKKRHEERLARKEAHNHHVHLAKSSSIHHGQEHAMIAHLSNWRSRLIHSALSYRGIPYVYGGSGRSGFDCSGFTRFVYMHYGIHLPHNAKEQFEIGEHISRKDLRPGDLVFFHTVSSGISHVGMYIGHDRFVQASSRRDGGVRVDSLDEAYYNQAYRGARRYRRH